VTPRDRRVLVVALGALVLTSLGILGLIVAAALAS